ncbi:MAG: anti-sigma B factor antagonist [Flavobacteriales bacterium]|jgi:anti-sigma B factor antagonist
MNFSTIKKEGVCIISVLSEKLNAQIAPELKSAIVMANKEGNKNLIIDLSGARYCDSSGLSALLVGNRLCLEASGVFVLAGLQPIVKKVISITQLDKVLNITSNVEEAEKMIFN